MTVTGWEWTGKEDMYLNVFNSYSSNIYTSTTTTEICYGALKKSPWRCCWEFQKCLWYGWDFLCLPKLPLWSYNQRISFCKKKNKDHHSNKPKIMINYSLNFINFLGMIFIQLALTFLLSGSCSVQGCFLIIIHM